MTSRAGTISTRLSRPTTASKGLPTLLNSTRSKSNRATTRDPSATSKTPRNQVSLPSTTGIAKKELSPSSPTRDPSRTLSSQTLSTNTRSRLTIFFCNATRQLISGLFKCLLITCRLQLLALNRKACWIPSHSKSLYLRTWCAARMRASISIRHSISHYRTPSLSTPSPLLTEIPSRCRLTQSPSSPSPPRLAWRRQTRTSKTKITGLQCLTFAA